MSSTSVSPSYGLYDYQRQVMLDAITSITRPLGMMEPYPRVLLHLPTGAGKTRIATHLVCELLNRAEQDSLVVWLASGSELLEQAADELVRGWGFLGRHEVHVHRYWGRQDLNFDNLPGGVLVAGLGKLHFADRRSTGTLAQLSRRVRAVIFDEAHQAPAETYSYVLEQLVGQGGALVGLTATPGRGWGLSDEDERLADLFQSNRIEIDSRGHDNPVAYLIANGYLARPVFRSVDFSSQGGQLEDPDGADYSADFLTALGDDKDRNERIVNLVASELRRCGRMIVFCPSVRSAEDCQEMAASAGIRSGVVTALTAPEDRSRVIEEFRQRDGDAMALFNYGVLTTGFDAPTTRGVVVARPTRSVVLYSQMVGRGLRGLRSRGNRNAWIYTVVDISLPGFRSVADAFRNWEELWAQKASS